MSIMIICNALRGWPLMAKNYRNGNPLLALLFYLLVCRSSNGIVAHWRVTLLKLFICVYACLLGNLPCCMFSNEFFFKLFLMLGIPPLFHSLLFLPISHPFNFSCSISPILPCMLLWLFSCTLKCLS